MLAVDSKTGCFDEAFLIKKDLGILCTQPDIAAGATWLVSLIYEIPAKCLPVLGCFEGFSAMDTTVRSVAEGKLTLQFVVQSAMFFVERQRAGHYNRTQSKKA